jgi:hypothetical protein
MPALKALAPSQSEPSFLVTRIIVLALFVAIAIGGAIRFRRRSVSEPGVAKMPKAGFAFKQETQNVQNQE